MCLCLSFLLLLPSLYSIPLVCSFIRLVLSVSVIRTIFSAFVWSFVQVPSCLFCSLPLLMFRFRSIFNAILTTLKSPEKAPALSLMQFVEVKKRFIRNHNILTFVRSFVCSKRFFRCARKDNSDQLISGEFSERKIIFSPLLFRLLSFVFFSFRFVLYNTFIFCQFFRSLTVWLKLVILRTCE